MNSGHNFKDFKDEVLAYWKHHGRHTLPWRKTHHTYKVLVSEMMLQQTQVDRVVPFYKAFLRRFPTVQALAEAELSEVFALWKGLGYNRRAKFLRDTARAVVERHGGVMPKTVQELQALPGIGPYTARAVATFAYNSREVFIETNIRAVFIHHFFHGREKVSDQEILPLVQAVSELVETPREWYAALMDYGTYLKKQHSNPSRRSTQHTRQSKFEGSVRQVRGEILRRLSDGPLSAQALTKTTGFEAERIDRALEGLEKDHMVKRTRSRWHIA